MFKRLIKVIAILIVIPIGCIILPIEMIVYTIRWIIIDKDFPNEPIIGKLVNWVFDYE